jgi:hypothetical protein
MIGWAHIQDLQGTTDSRMFDRNIRYGHNRTYKLTLWKALKRNLRKYSNIDRGEFISQLIINQRKYATYGGNNSREWESVEWYLGRLKAAGYIKNSQDKITLIKTIPANFTVSQLKLAAKTKTTDFLKEDEFKI